MSFMKFSFLILFACVVTTSLAQRVDIGVKIGVNHSRLTGSFSPKVGVEYPKKAKFGPVFGAFGD